MRKASKKQIRATRTLADNRAGVLLAHLLEGAEGLLGQVDVGDGEEL